MVVVAVWKLNRFSLGNQVVSSESREEEESRGGGVRRRSQEEGSGEKEESGRDSTSCLVQYQIPVAAGLGASPVLPPSPPAPHPL